MQVLCLALALVSSTIDHGVIGATANLGDLIEYNSTGVYFAETTGPSSNSQTEWYYYDDVNDVYRAYCVDLSTIVVYVFDDEGYHFARVDKDYIFHEEIPEPEPLPPTDPPPPPGPYPPVDYPTTPVEPYLPGAFLPSGYSLGSLDSVEVGSVTFYYRTILNPSNEVEGWAWYENDTTSYVSFLTGY